jgi:hypothetical protein
MIFTTSPICIGKGDLLYLVSSIIQGTAFLRNHLHFEVVTNSSFVCITYFT